MANPFVKGWRYLMALFGSKIDEYADPKVQIQQAIEDAQRQHQALVLSAAGQARKAVENNKMVLETRLAERTKLLSQLEQAKMQEAVAKSLEGMGQLTAPGNTPSLDEVRDKIERRYANAMGRAELASSSVEGRMIEVQKTTLDMAGSSRLEQIRASMAGELTSAPAQPAIEGGENGGEQEQADSNDGSVARLDEIRKSLQDKDSATG
jgi:phage shock protein A